MTREEFIKNYNLVVEIKSTDSKTGEFLSGKISLLYRRNEELVEKGDLIYEFKDNAGKI